jgi:NAD(P)-dependent dehydrogenase (short-subunit alcohol dehydrogenase family)
MARYELAGRIVAITGSTGGLGGALGTKLRERGGKLALMDLDGAAAATQAAGLGDETVARGYAIDVRDYDSVRLAIDAAAGDFGRLDVVIAGAGIGKPKPAELMDPVEFETTIDINLNGVYRTFKAALPCVARTEGQLVAISSMAAFIHSPLNTHYTASKAGVWALCDSLRLEVRHLGITVSSVHPTFFDTPMMDGVLADPAGAALWGEHKSWPWKMVPRETVINDTVRGIERRAKITVIPKANTPVARAAGFVRPLIDRVGFIRNPIPRTIEIAHQHVRPD